MKNVEYTQNGDILTIKIDLSKNFGPSASGKTNVIASTEGNQKVAKTAKGEEIALGINCYFKPAK